MNVSWPVENLENKQLIAIPLLLATILGSAVAYHWYSTGDPVPLSMEFAGGSFVRIQGIENMSHEEAMNLKTEFQKTYGEKPEIRIKKVDEKVIEIEIETSKDLARTEENQIAEDQIRELLSRVGAEKEADVTINSMGSIITKLYQKQALYAAIAAVIAMAIILFIALRHFTVVGGILSVVGLDFIGILGVMAILGIPLSLASMAGILLIFGYAVNTNILLSTNVLKRKGETPRKRAGRAMSTGIKMSSTSATAMLILNLITTAPELEQISAAILIGILIDMVNTWLLNSGLILKHQEGTRGKYHARI